MVIAAKFRGRCRVCGGTIVRGERIDWTKADGAAHERCAPESTETAAVERCEHCGGRMIHAMGRLRCSSCCPTCHGPMSASYARKGYQCDSCADAEEFGAIAGGW